MKRELRLWRRKWGYEMEKILTKKQIEWAYEMWCLGYTQIQIANALYVCEKTINRALKGRPRKRPILKYNP